MIEIDKALFNNCFDPVAQRFVKAAGRVTWSVTSLQLFRSCPHKFYLSYIMGMRPLAKDKPLLIGEVFHTTLQDWYTHTGGNDIDFMRHLVRKKVSKFRKEFEKNLALYTPYEVDSFLADLQSLQGMLVGYARKYERHKKDLIIDTRYIEKEFLISQNGYDVTGKIDLMVAKRSKKSGKLIWMIWDHKTSSDIRALHLEALPLNLQMRVYLWAGREVFKKPVQVATYSMIKKCALRKKKTEHIDDYIDRISIDYIQRPDMYFRREIVRFHPDAVAAAKREFELGHRHYTSIMARSDWSASHSWSQNDHSCTDFHRLCPYFSYCRDYGRSPLWTIPGFKFRERNDGKKEEATKKK